MGFVTWSMPESCREECETVLGADPLYTLCQRTDMYITESVDLMDAAIT